MSDLATSARVTTDPATPKAPRRRPGVGTLVRVALVVVVAILPLYAENALLQTGLFAMGAVVAAIGLTVLVGAAGELSLAHAFFLAVGAYGYAYLAGTSGVAAAGAADGLGLPPLLAAVLAVLAAGAAGLIFSPIASRLRGIYLGVASLALVAIGSYVYDNFETLTGGTNGRALADFSVPGFSFGPDSPILVVAGVEFHRYEKLWELFLVLTVLAYLFAQNILRGRMGRAMQTMRDSEVAAAVMGVDVRRTKAGAFVLSSMYAGLGGVMIGLAFTRVTPEYFVLPLSISYLAMIVIGGLGSVGGAALGATFVTVLPYLLQTYSDQLPFVAQPGSSGYDPGKIAALLYGAAVIAVVMFEPGGLNALGKRLTGRRPQRTLDPVPDGLMSTPPPDPHLSTDSPDPARTPTAQEDSA